MPPRPEQAARLIARTGRLPSRRLLALGVCFAVAALVITYLALAPRYRLKTYHAQLVREGEKLAIADISKPAAPKQVVAANEFLRLARQLPPAPPRRLGPPAAMVHLVPGKALVGWSLSMVPSSYDEHTDHPPTWDELDLEIAPYRSLLRQIHHLVRTNIFDWDLDYTLGPNLLLPHLAPQKAVVQWLTATALNDLHAGRLDTAQAALLAQLDLTRQSEDETILITQLVRIALSAIAFNCTWAGCQAEGWTDEALAELQVAWTRLSYFEPAIRTLETERAISVETFARYRRDPALLRQFVSQMGGVPPLFKVDSLPGALFDALTIRGLNVAESIRLQLWRWCWSYDDERAYLRQSQQVLDALRASEPVQPKMNTLEALERQRPPDDRRFLLRGLLGGVEAHSVYLKVVYAECLRSLAITALALKRFHQLHDGRYPDTLDQLVPQFLAKLPQDPIDGQPLRYRRDSNDRFTLYSIGENGVDDGGNPAPPESKVLARYHVFGLDTVWPWPAPADQIPAHPAKP